MVSLLFGLPITRRGGKKKYSSLSELETLTVFLSERSGFHFSATHFCASEDRWYVAVLPFQRAGFSDVGLHFRKKKSKGTQGDLL